MADTKKKRRKSKARKRAKTVARQRKSLARSKRRVLKWNSKSRHGVFMRPASKARGNPIGTPKPPAKATPAKAAQKPALKTKDKPDDDSKAKGQSANLRDARPHEKPEPPDRASGSVHKEASKKEPQKQVKKAAPAKKAKG